MNMYKTKDVYISRVVIISSTEHIAASKRYSFLSLLSNRYKTKKIYINRLIDINDTKRVETSNGTMIEMFIYRLFQPKWWISRLFSTFIICLD